MNVASLVDVVAHYVRSGFCDLWPSIGNNAPTESNIRSALTAVLSPLGYRCFSEFPFRVDGTIIHVDFVAYWLGSKGSVQILSEMKTDSGNDSRIGQWIDDFNRLTSLALSSNTESEPAYIERIKEAESVRLSWYWTDNDEKPERIINALTDNNDERNAMTVKPGTAFDDLAEVEHGGYLVRRYIGWGLNLFCLSDHETIGPLS